MVCERHAQSPLPIIETKISAGRLPSQHGAISPPLLFWQHGIQSRFNVGMIFCQLGRQTRKEYFPCLLEIEKPILSKLGRITSWRLFPGGFMSRGNAVKALLFGAVVIGSCFGWLQVESRYPILLRLAMPEYKARPDIDDEAMQSAVIHYEQTGQKIWPLRWYNPESDRFEEYNRETKRFEPKK